MKFCATELRRNLVDPEAVKKVKRNPIYIVLDDVWDTYNIGAVFRLADAVAAEKLLLCKGTETPPNSRIKKASINTWQWVPWEYSASTVDAISRLRQDYSGQANIKIVAIEQASNSIPYDKYDYQLPIALVVGNETTGVSKEVLNICDTVVELPMFGINVSLNVMVSLGIVLYEAIEKNNLTI